ncbi:hypothetical protein ACH5RR_002823 [Cinchona calisaya]|uniref:Uncharacterized protein n=1 Tax=Cinchona calisaya TaxID=153742 RepID=A0ABD3AT24_9GENT
MRLIWRKLNLGPRFGTLVESKALTEVRAMFRFGTGRITYKKYKEGRFDFDGLWDDKIDAYTALGKACHDLLLAISNHYWRQFVGEEVTVDNDTLVRKFITYTHKPTGTVIQLEFDESQWHFGPPNDEFGPGSKELDEQDTDTGDDDGVGPSRQS